VRPLPPTRVEAGCIAYDQHIDNENPVIFMFYETWGNRALWQDHMGSGHIKAHGEATDGLIVNVILHEMTQIA
jgi:quinol monooxygenase YgiN